MVQIENLIEKTPSFKQITADLQPKNHQLITGISGSARTELLSALSKEGQRQLPPELDSGRDEAHQGEGRDDHHLRAYAGGRQHVLRERGGQRPVGVQAAFSGHHREPVRPVSG